MTQCLVSFILCFMFYNMYNSLTINRIKYIQAVDFVEYDEAKSC